MNQKDPFYKKTRNIPEETKLKVVEHYRLVYQRKLEPPKESLQFLLKVFNDYVNDYPNTINCSKCRRAIFDFWKATIRFWDKENLI